MPAACGCPARASTRAAPLSPRSLSSTRETQVGGGGVPAGAGDVGGAGQPGSGLSIAQATGDSVCPSRVPARWTSTQKTWKTARVGSPTAPRNPAITSSTSSSLTSMCLVGVVTVHPAPPPALPHPGVTHAGHGPHFLPAGSPFSVKVTGEGRVKESITRRRRAPSVANVGSHCDLSLKIPGRGCGEPGRAAGRRWGHRPPTHRATSSLQKSASRT